MPTPPRRRRLLRFYNPIEGKPTATKLSSLFLISPESLIKINGLSFRGLLTQSAGESFTKKWGRVLSGKQLAKARILTEITEVLPVGDAFTKVMEAAISGDEDATRRLDEMGLWEAFLLGAQNGRPLLDHAAHILSIERASSAPQHAVEQGNFKDAASLLAKDELLSMYLWPEAFSLIESAQTLDSLLLLRASVALEVQLSILAAMDVQSGLAESIVQRVMPRADQPGWNPTKLLFTYVLKENGLSTIQALYEHKPLNGQRLELSTLKRWSAGSHFPNQVWFGPIVKALWGDANYAPAWNHYWAAKHLNYVGYLAQTFSEAARKLEGTDNEAKYRPWPHYPFGYSCFEDWAQARFPVWKTYHHHRRVQP